jgi:hypothetical protein
MTCMFAAHKNPTGWTDATPVSDAWHKEKNALLFRLK